MFKYTNNLKRSCGVPVALVSGTLLLLTIFLALNFLSLGKGIDTSIVFQSIGSVNNMATGGAFLYMPNGNSSEIVWNPANLAYNQYGTIKIYGSRAALYNDMVIYNHFATSIVNDIFSPILIPMALNWIRICAGEMYSANSWISSLAFNLPYDNASVGFSVKVNEENISGDRLYAPGMDIGITIHPTENTHISIVGIDVINKTKIAGQHIDPVFRAGIDLLTPSERLIGLHSALTLESPYNGQHIFLLRGGTELQISDSFFIRVGVIVPLQDAQNTIISGGIGLKLGNGMQIDFAYTSHQELGNSLFVSFSIPI